MLKDAIMSTSNSGFSINGGSRNVNYIGKTSVMSAVRTPFRRNLPIGHGGRQGKYYTNPDQKAFAMPIKTRGTQQAWVKPSTLSTRGMLATKHRWVKSGQYPNFWVKPIVGGTAQSDFYSQSLYLQKKRASNMCVLGVNRGDDYTDDVHRNQCTYVKTLDAPMDSSIYTNYKQKGCNLVGDFEKQTHCVSII
jgi:hypothetical protein